MNNLYQKLIIGLILSVLSLSALGDKAVSKSMVLFDDDQGYWVTLEARSYGWSSIMLRNINTSDIYLDCDANLQSDPMTIPNSGKSGYVNFTLDDGNWACTVNTLSIVNASAQCAYNGGLHAQTIGKTIAKIAGKGMWVSSHSKTTYAQVDCLVNLDGLQLENMFGEIQLITEMYKDGPQSPN
jgi:hypothetical protein